MPKPKSTIVDSPRIRKATCKHCGNKFEYETPVSVLNAGFKLRKYCNEKCRKSMYRDKYSKNYKKQITIASIAFGGI